MTPRARRRRGSRRAAGAMLPPALPPALTIDTLEVDGETLVVFAFPREPRTTSGALTAAELAITELILQGLTTAQIAAARRAASATISAQLQSIYRKLGVSSRTELTHKLG